MVCDNPRCLHRQHPRSVSKKWGVRLCIDCEAICRMFLDGIEQKWDIRIHGPRHKVDDWAREWLKHQWRKRASERRAKEES